MMEGSPRREARIFGPRDAGMRSSSGKAPDWHRIARPISSAISAALWSPWINAVKHGCSYGPPSRTAGSSGNQSLSTSWPNACHGMRVSS